MVGQEKFWTDMIERENIWVDRGSGPRDVVILISPDAYEINKINKYIQTALWNYLYPNTKTINQEQIDDLCKLTENNNTLRYKIDLNSGSTLIVTKV